MFSMCFFPVIRETALLKKIKTEWRNGKVEEHWDASWMIGFSFLFQPRDAEAKMSFWIIPPLW